MGARPRGLGGGRASAEIVKALLDERLSSEIAVELRRRKLDVEAVAERPELVGSSDQAVMDAAAAEGRAVVTNNITDFRPIAARRIASGQGHCGLILLPAKRSRTRAAAGLLADAIESVMRASPPGIPDTERWAPPFRPPKTHGPALGPLPRGDCLRAPRGSTPQGADRKRQHPVSQAERSWPGMKHGAREEPLAGASRREACGPRRRPIRGPGCGGY